MLKYTVFKENEMPNLDVIKSLLLHQNSKVVVRVEVNTFISSTLP